MPPRIKASHHSHQTHPHRREFELNITEDPPTPDQLKSMLEYVGAQKASTFIKGAKDEADAMMKLEQNVENLQWPIVCYPIFQPRPSLSSRVADQF
jgi:hypothetical protein